MLAVGAILIRVRLRRIAIYRDNYIRSAGIWAAVLGACRSRSARGHDAHATADQTPALRKLIVTLEKVEVGRNCMPPEEGGSNRKTTGLEYSGVRSSGPRGMAAR
jgi:hypothetical protein